jgi:hypothetical protein
MSLSTWMSLSTMDWRPEHNEVWRNKHIQVSQIKDYSLPAADFLANPSEGCDLLGCSVELWNVWAGLVELWIGLVPVNVVVLWVDLVELWVGFPDWFIFIEFPLSPLFLVLLVVIAARIFLLSGVLLATLSIDLAAWNGEISTIQTYLRIKVHSQWSVIAYLTPWVQ